MRSILALCFVFVFAAPAAAQTAEELVAYILRATEDGQGQAGVTKTLSKSPAVFETSNELFALRLTVSTVGRCRYKVVEQTSRKDKVETGTVTFDFDFSAAVPPVTTAQGGGAVRQTLVRISGLRLTACNIVDTPIPGVPPEVQRRYNQVACDGFGKEGMPATASYSAERATKALATLKANFCK